MKKIIPIVIMGMLILSGIGAATAISKKTTQTFSESIVFSEPVIQKRDSRIEVDLAEATSSFMGEGKFDLPVISKVYTFPSGTHIDEVTITFSEPYDQPLSSSIKPAVIPQYISSELRVKTAEKNQENSDGSLIEKIYPEKQVNYHIGAGLDKGEHVIYLSISCCPIQYNPSTKTLSISDTAHIAVDYTLPSTPAVFGDEYDLLILTPEEFSDELQPLVEYKNSRDISTTLVTLEEIPSQGIDIQEDIKYFIKNAFEDWGITYVLLVGSGVEGEEKFPVRNAWVPSGSYELYFPSDLYYADFYNFGGGFSDWDFDNDGKYAEYPDDILAVDIYPDVYLGRLACNDAAEVTSTVNKIINFMEHNQVMEKIVQMGGDTFPGDPENIDEGEFCNSAVMAGLPGYSTQQLWASNGQLTKANIIDAINTGVDFVDFSGHGSYMSWATHPHNDESRWLPDDGQYTGFLYINVPWLFNTKKLPVVFLNACSCNKFSDSPECLGWSFIKNGYGGGIASYGASGIGYGTYGSAEPERLFGWLEVNTFKELRTDKKVGDVWGDLIADYYNEFFFDLEDADYKTMFEYSLLGDPSLVIEDGPDPESVDVQHFPLLNFLHRLMERFPLLERLFSFPLLKKLVNI